MTEEEVWWERISRVLGIMLAGAHEKDWQDAANCQVDSHEDLSFIRKPDEVTQKRWERICAKCPVIEECFNWANKNDITGTFIAGEWRE